MRKLKVKPQEIWEIGVAAVREVNGTPSNGDTWKDVRRRREQLVGWKAIADWINKNFVSRTDADLQ